MDRAHFGFCVAICLETAVCFALPVFLLFFGIFFLPFFGLAVARGSSPSLLAVVLTLLGSAGIAGVARILFLLCARRQHDSMRPLTISALVCGAAAVLIYASTFETPTAPIPTLLLVTIVVLPLACTLHLLYLARRPLFCRPPRAA